MSFANDKTNHNLNYFSFKAFFGYLYQLIQTVLFISDHTWILFSLEYSDYFLLLADQ